MCAAWQDPPLVLRSRFTRAGVARLLLCLGLLTVVAGQANAATTVDVYFLQGEQAVAVSRPGSDVQAAVEGLLGGPTADEKKQSIRTQLPPGVPLRSVTVARGVATVDLGEKFANGTSADSLSARLAQLVLTVNRQPGVKSVRVLVKGGVPLGLFPGVDLTKPVTIESIAAPQGPTPVAPPSTTGPPTASTAEVEDKLAELGYLDPAEDDGRANQATFNAVMAFQKWEGLDRDGQVGPKTTAALATATRPTPLTKGPSGTRVEVLLDRQLTLFIVDNKVRAHPPRVQREGGLRDADRPVPHRAQVHEGLVGAVRGLAAVGELLRRRRRLPRARRRAAVPRVARLRARAAAATRSGSTTASRWARR